MTVKGALDNILIASKNLDAAILSEKYSMDGPVDKWKLESANLRLSMENLERSRKVYYDALDAEYASWEKVK